MTHDTSNRVGHFMHISSGRKYWPMDPRASDVDINDIAHHLSMKCRWNGATKRFYSIAEHSVYVSHLVPPIDALEALMHDAAETYITDFIRPLKYDPEFAEPYAKLERINELAIAERFNLTYPFPKSVKIADDQVTAAELEQAIERSHRETWEPNVFIDTSVIAPITIRFLTPDEAEDEFMDRFVEVAIESGR